MHETIENIIKKNLPEKKGEVSWLNEDATGGYNIALDEINTSLIADEVLKVVVEKIKEDIIEDRNDDIPQFEYGYNTALINTINLLTNSSTLEGERSEHLSTNKENKNNEEKNNI